jgi:hypothetical protein
MNEILTADQIAVYIGGSRNRPTVLKKGVAVIDKAHQVVA